MLKFISLDISQPHHNSSCYKTMSNSNHCSITFYSENYERDEIYFKPEKIKMFKETESKLYVSNIKHLSRKDSKQSSQLL